MMTIIIAFSSSSFRIMTNRQSFGVLLILRTLTISDIEFRDKLHIQVTSQYIKDILE